MLGLKRGTVELYPHEAEWERAAEDTIAQLKKLLGAAAIDIQHVGSTAIKGIHAKPIIDIAVAVDPLDGILAHVGNLERNGIAFRGKDHESQYLFVMGDFEADIRTHHIHIVEWNSEPWMNYINFRDYLNAFPERVREYDALKQSLMNRFAADRGSYTAGKHELIDRLLKEAQAWRSSNENDPTA